MALSRGHDSLTMVSGLTALTSPVTTNLMGYSAWTSRRVRPPHFSVLRQWERTVLRSLSGAKMVQKIPMMQKLPERPRDRIACSLDSRPRSPGFLAPVPHCHHHNPTDGAVLPSHDYRAKNVSVDSAVAARGAEITSTTTVRCSLQFYNHRRNEHANYVF